MKHHWFGARDHVDHTMCGGCDDDADCTWNDRRDRVLSLIFAAVCLVATYLLLRFA